MTNKPKAIGTAFETACARWLSDRLGQRIERRALHGTKDQGDLGWVLTPCGSAGIVECKAGAAAEAAQPANVRKWRAQTIAERENSAAGFALLVLKTKGVGRETLGRTRCDVTVADICRLLGMRPCEASESVWVTIDLETACCLAEGSCD